MEQQPKIELYVTRTFSEKLSTAFAFLRENWRPLLKYFTYFMLPASLVLGFFVNHFWGGYMSLLGAVENAGNLDDAWLIRFGLTTGATIIVSTLVYMLLIAVLFTLFRLYFARPQCLQDLQADEFRPEFMKCLKRSAIYLVGFGLLVIAFILLFGLLVCVGFAIHPVVGAVLLLLGYAGIFAVIIPLSISQHIYMMEDEVNIIQAITKSFRLGFATWGGIVAISFVFGMITSVIQSFTMAPWYILFVIKMVFTLSNEIDGSFVNSIFFTFIEYLTCVVQCLGYLLSAVITTVAMLIQYGHASDKIDGVGVAKNIDRFDEFDNF